MCVRTHAYVKEITLVYIYIYYIMCVWVKNWSNVEWRHWPTAFFVNILSTWAVIFKRQFSSFSLKLFFSQMYILYSAILLFKDASSYSTQYEVLGIAQCALQSLADLFSRMPSRLVPATCGRAAVHAWRLFIYKYPLYSIARHPFIRWVNWNNL